VDVAAGEETIVRKGMAPSAPRKIPASLFLKVQRPKRVQREKTLAVRGKTAPGSIIRVNGVAVKVGDTGEFTSVVALKEGKNNVEVESHDASGRRKKDTVPVVVDSRGPNVGGDVTWGPKK
jgi:hypothetical protein